MSTPTPTQYEVANALVRRGGPVLMDAATLLDRDLQPGREADVAAAVAAGLRVDHVERLDASGEDEGRRGALHGLVRAVAAGADAEAVVELSRRGVEAEVFADALTDQDQVKDWGWGVLGDYIEAVPRRDAAEAMVSLIQGADAAVRVDGLAAGFLARELLLAGYAPAECGRAVTEGLVPAVALSADKDDPDGRALMVNTINAIRARRT